MGPPLTMQGYRVSLCGSISGRIRLLIKPPPPPPFPEPSGVTVSQITEVTKREGGRSGHERGGGGVVSR